MAVINISTLSVVSSAIYLYAASISNIVLLHNAVIVLFLSDIDEQALIIFQSIVQTWTVDVESNIGLMLLNQSEIKIPEVRDGSSAENDLESVEGFAAKYNEKKIAKIVWCLGTTPIA